RSGRVRPVSGSALFCEYFFSMQQGEIVQSTGQRVLFFYSRPFKGTGRSYKALEISKVKCKLL
ncbi:hypothetical protein, partial [Citrobacter freundii]|uniref:hypothetical protein n=1 Tax=Citrobacter freundii TaxID=546 RepID=UPI0011417899